ncbi:MAG: thiamine pyrophosphate-binding protein [Candidatus Helarchaeota archaeon]
MAEKKVYNGGDVLIKALLAENVRYLFGVPGGQILNMYDAIYKWGREEGIDTIMFRHEQGAAHAADAWGRVTGTPGVCFGTVGPGALHLVPGVGAAWSDNIPVVAIVPQVSKEKADRMTLQGDLDQVTMFKPITKFQKSIDEIEKIPDAVQKCFREALSGRPRPVLLEIAEDAFLAKTEDLNIVEPNKYRFTGRIGGDPELVKKAVDLLLAAKKPLLVGGGGINMGFAEKKFTELASLLNCPVATSVMGVGSILNNDLNVGASLTSSGVARAMTTADVILVIGCKISYTLGFGDPPLWNPEAKVIQVDIDPGIIGKSRPVDVGIVGDASLVIEQIIKEIGNRKSSADDSWLKSLQDAKNAAFQAITKKALKERTPMRPERMIKEVFEFMNDDAILIIDGGDIAVFAMEQVGMQKVRPPRSTLNSIGMGHLGTGIPYAIGAKLAHPERQVITIQGDGSFLMNVQDLATAVQYELPIICCVGNNCAWGMIKSGQKLFMKKRYIDVEFCEEFNYAEIAKGFGCHGESVSDPAEIKNALKRAVESKKPSVIEVRTDNSIPDGTKLMGSMGLL